MKYFFILGRNPQLSRAEVFCYLESRKLDFKEEIFDGNLIVLEMDEFDFNIQDFGGVLMAGKILFFGKDFKSFLDKGELVPADKFSFSIIGNFGEEELKEKFKSERKRAMLRHGRKKIRFQNEDEGWFSNADFSFFCYETKRGIYFGIVEKKFNSVFQEKRDMGKPYRREELAISPRLSRILINLSGVKKGERLMDCFCGVGGILQEALVLGIDVIGVDKNKEAIAMARENLSWLRKNFWFDNKYDLFIFDSAKVNKDLIGSVQGVAFESALGEILRKKISRKEAKNFISGFENFIVPVLRNLKRITNGRIAMTLPVVSGERVDISAISQRAGLRVFNKFGLKFPISESRPGQFVSRDFVVLY